MGGSLSSAVQVCQAKLKDSFTSPQQTRFAPLPRSRTLLHLKDIFVEVQVTEKEEAEALCKESGGEEALFLPLEGSSRTHPLFVAGDLRSSPSPDLKGLFSYFGRFSPTPASPGTSVSLSADDVAILGAAGSGKTVAFARRLPYGWAIGEFLLEVCLLFVVIVRNCDESSLESLLGVGRLGLRKADRENLLEFLATNDNPEKVLIVVDGEYRLEDFEEPSGRARVEGQGWVMIAA